MTNVFDESAVLQEVVNELRNADILTTTERHVTTTLQTGSINGTTIGLVQTDAKNVRYITVNSTTLNYGADYTINFDDEDNPVPAVISFASSQSGSYAASYDYGPDRIYPDYAKPKLTINQFPRIGMGFIDTASEAGGWGNVNNNRSDISIIAYAPAKKKIRTMIKAIRTWVIENQNSLHYLKLIKPTLQGPVGPGNFPEVKDKIHLQNLDFRSTLNYEKN